MKKLFYQLMYDKSLKRGMSILEMLYQSRKPITVEKLSRDLGISSKTVHSTLEFIKSQMPETLSLSLVGKEVRLINEGNQPVEVALIEMAYETMSFQILKHAYLEERLTAPELAQKLFISESALRARIRHMNKTLQLFDCSISAYSIKIQGSEAGIRFFAYEYFNEFQELCFRTCEDSLQYCQAIYESMKDAYRSEGMQLMNFSHQKISRLLLVTKDRLDIDRFIKIDPKLIKKMSKRSSYTLFKQVYRAETAKHLQNPNIPEAEIVWAYVSCLDAVVYSSDGDDLLVRDEENDSHSKENTLAALEQAAASLDIRNEDREVFLATHMAYFLNKALLTELSPVFQTGAHYIADYIAENLESLYSIWRDFLTEYHDAKMLRVYNLHSMAAQLAMISSQFVYNKKTQAHTLLCSFEGEAGFAVYLETVAKTLLPKGVKGVFLHNKTITPDLIKEIKPDLVVCNYELPEKNEGCRLLRMSQIPQNKEWVLLRELIMNPHYENSALNEYGALGQ